MGAKLLQGVQKSDSPRAVNQTVYMATTEADKKAFFSSARLAFLYKYSILCYSLFQYSKSDINKIRPVTLLLLYCLIIVHQHESYSNKTHIREWGVHRTSTELGESVRKW